MSSGKTITEMRELLGRCNASTVELLMAAVQMCKKYGHQSVLPEHILVAGIDQSNRDVRSILDNAGVELDPIRTECRSYLSEQRAIGTPRPPFSDVLVSAVERAWYHASVAGKRRSIRSGDLLWALLDASWTPSSDAWRMIREHVSSAALAKDFTELVQGSAEEAAPVEAPESDSGASQSSEPEAPTERTGSLETQYISKYCINFSHLAEQGQLDPVFGRDGEIRETLNTLARRRKNNPILVGEAGVGKTAIVEGLALRIRDGDVPANFTGSQVIGLDIGLLQAGASVKGEFEKRLKGVIDEIKNSAIPTIFFIDEAHTLIGAGGAKGTGDAANLLKPALARGELRAIAATTWSEYKQYFETDPALTRRFQLIEVKEPGEEDAATMLRGLRGKYEQAHSVRILDEAIVAAVHCAKRYITGRNLPDAAIDLLDTAAAKLNNVLQSKPPMIDQLERDLGDLEIALHSVRRELNEGRKDAKSRMDELEKRKKELSTTLDDLKERWQVERAKVEEIHEIAKELAVKQEEIEEARRDLDWDRAAQLEAGTIRELAGSMATKFDELRDIQGQDPLLFAEVDAKMIGQVVMDWTGVPVNQMAASEAEKATRLKDQLQERIKGQDFAIDVMSEALKASRAGVADPDRPIGVFLCLGPSGVGKTECALTVADLVFGGDQFVTKINMSEYGSGFSESRLIGAPPGYVGYGKGGVLTEAVRKKPYSVVLLDEVDRADQQVWNLFYSPFERGEMNDGEGRRIDFRNVCIFMTSNLGSDAIVQWRNQRQEALAKLVEEAPKKAAAAGGSAALPMTPEEESEHGIPTMDELIDVLRDMAGQRFTEPLMARMTILPFLPLETDVLQQIALLKLGKLRGRLANQRKLELMWSDPVPGWIADNCTHSGMGARLVDQIIQTEILPRITNGVLTELAAGREPRRLTLEIDADGPGGADLSLLCE